MIGSVSFVVALVVVVVVSGFMLYRDGTNWAAQSRRILCLLCFTERGLQIQIPSKQKTKQKKVNYQRRSMIQLRTGRCLLRWVGRDRSPAFQIMPPEGNPEGFQHCWTDFIPLVSQEKQFEWSYIIRQIWPDRSSFESHFVSDWLRYSNAVRR